MFSVVLSFSSSLSFSLSHSLSLPLSFSLLLSLFLSFFRLVFLSHRGSVCSHMYFRSVRSIAMLRVFVFSSLLRLSNKCFSPVSLFEFEIFACVGDQQNYARPVMCLEPGSNLRDFVESFINSAAPFLLSSGKPLIYTRISSAAPHSS